MAEMTDAELRVYAQKLGFDIWASRLRGTPFERLKGLLYGSLPTTTTPEVATTAKHPQAPILPGNDTDSSPRAVIDDGKLADEVSRVLKECELKGDSVSDFAILGIADNSDASVVKKAYREKCLSMHPDKRRNEIAVAKAGGTAACDDAFDKVKTAYERITRGCPKLPVRRAKTS